MADHWQILFVCILFTLSTQVHSQQNDVVPITLVEGAVQKGAVCSDGSPAGYYHSEGFEDGVNNWLFFLEGGGWCYGQGTCRDRAKGRQGSNQNITSEYFSGILSSDKEINPDFHNWNRVFVRYCDGSSFIGDNEADDDGFHVQLRGSKIFSAVMDELLHKGMKDANSAILSGGSAGGLATMLHCDDFRALIPNASRVKCLADSGFFIRESTLPLSEWIFNQTVEFHNLTNFLPTSCTSRMNSSLCLFPEYGAAQTQTPLFILMSGFDRHEIQDNMEFYPDKESWNRCITYLNCTADQKQRIIDHRNTLLEKLKGLGNNPSRGLFITSCYTHGMIDTSKRWNSNGPFRLENRTIAQAFSDWYFDRSHIQLIDAQSDFPLNCTLP